jgi:hypothetical protein
MSTCRQACRPKGGERGVRPGRIWVCWGVELAEVRNVKSGGIDWYGRAYKCTEILACLPACLPAEDSTNLTFLPAFTCAGARRLLQPG